MKSFQIHSSVHAKTYIYITPNWKLIPLLCFGGKIMIMILHDFVSPVLRGGGISLTRHYYVRPPTPPAVDVARSKAVQRSPPPTNCQITFHYKCHLIWFHVLWQNINLFHNLVWKSTKLNNSIYQTILVPNRAWLSA